MQLTRERVSHSLYFHGISKTPNSQKCVTGRSERRAGNGALPLHPDRYPMAAHRSENRRFAQYRTGSLPTFRNAIETNRALSWGDNATRAARNRLCYLHFSLNGHVCDAIDLITHAHIPCISQRHLSVERLLKTASCLSVL